MKVVNGIKLFDSGELMELLGVTYRTLSIMRKKGVLPYTRIGRACYTSEDSLADYLSGKTTEIAKRRKAEAEAPANGNL